MKVGALCAGYGGLELGLELAGWQPDLRWVCEIDPHASQVLDQRFGVPNLGDLTTADWSQVEPVDCITAGFPCQPVSVAGARKGTADERWIIDDIGRAVRHLRPSVVVLENVPGLLTANDGDAMARVCSVLAHAGFDAEWVTVAAADIGAPHRRLRWFCVARDTDRTRTDTRPTAGASRGATGESGGGSVADASHVGLERGRQPRRRRTGSTDGGRPAPHADGGTGRPEPVTVAERRHQVHTRLDRQATPDTWGPYLDAIRRWQRVMKRPAPEPRDADGRLNPHLVEWMMGLPDGWVTDCGLPRSAQLRVLGNGVVPQQAAHALRLLAGRCAA